MRRSFKKLIYQPSFLIFALLFAILVSSPSIYAVYPKTGGSEVNYVGGVGTINSENTLAGVTGVDEVQIPQETIKVEDLDGDGIREMISIDGQTITLYTGNGLTLLDSISSSNISGITHSVVFDIDGDGYKEFIIGSSGSDAISIFEYNGSIFKKDGGFNLPDTYLSGLPASAPSELMLSCKDTDDCIAIYTSFSSYSAGQVNITAVFFNSTELGNNTVLKTTTNGRMCFSGIRSVPVANYDLGSSDVYHFTYHDNTGGLNEVELAHVFVTGQKNPKLASPIVTVASGVKVLGGNTQSCNITRQGKHFTSPVLFEYDGSTGNGIESMIGYIDSTNNLKAEVVRADGSIPFGTYPNFGLTAEADSIGNIMQCTAFSEGADDTILNKDFCLAGYYSIGNTITLMAGTKINKGFLDDRTKVFVGDLNNFGLNESVDFTGSYYYQGITHAVQYETTLTNGVNFNEFVNPYGVMRIWEGSVLGSGFEWQYNNIFPNGDTRQVAIPNDVGSIGLDDILVRTDSNIFYLDDGTENDRGRITNVNFNPCINTTIQENTTMSVSVTVTDDLDNVNAQLSAYFGTSNQQDFISNNFSSPHVFTYAFPMNVSTNNGVIEIVGRDTFQPTLNDTQTFGFTVASVGVVAGDCSSNVNFEADIEAEEDLPHVNGTTDLDDNSIIGMVTPWSALFKISNEMVWFFGMFVVGLGILIGSFLASSALKDTSIIVYGFIGTLFFELLMLVIGAKLQIIPTALVVIVMVIFAVVLGLWFVHFLTGYRNSSGG